MNSPILITGKKFYDLLLTSDIDTNLVIDGVDSEFGFVWNKGDDFTEAGKEKFKAILFAPYKILQNGTIVIDPGVPMLGELFLSACAGYIGSSVYSRWFKEASC